MTQNEQSKTRSRRIIAFVLIGIVLLALIGFALALIFVPSPEPVTFRTH